MCWICLMVLGELLDNCHNILLSLFICGRAYFIHSLKSEKGMRNCLSFCIGLIENVWPSQAIRSLFDTYSCRYLPDQWSGTLIVINELVVTKGHWFSLVCPYTKTWQLGKSSCIRSTLLRYFWWQHYCWNVQNRFVTHYRNWPCTRQGLL